MTTELFESVTATVDANGRAVCTLQPLQAFRRWHVRRMTVTSTSSTLVPTVRVYRGEEIASKLVDGTYTGTLDHSDTNLILRSGEPLIFVFSAADVGSKCTATVEGEVVT